MPSPDKRLAAILTKLAARYPRPKVALSYRNPYELLAATILSAQCTDVQVNRVTPALFQTYPTPEALAAARLDQLETLIHATGFYHNKAKNLIGMAQAVRDRFHHHIPQTMEELLSLPGVARKTANVVLNAAFGVVVGIVVDTHVRRISQRLGLTQQEQPEKIEQDLMHLLPKKEWKFFALRMIQHGRDTCMAKSPACSRCPLQPECPSAVIYRTPTKRAVSTQPRHQQHRQE